MNAQDIKKLDEIKTGLGAGRNIFRRKTVEFLLLLIYESENELERLQNKINDLTEKNEILRRDYNLLNHAPKQSDGEK